MRTIPTWLLLHWEGCPWLPVRQLPLGAQGCDSISIPQAIAPHPGDDVERPVDLRAELLFIAFEQGARGAAPDGCLSSRQGPRHEHGALR